MVIRLSLASTSGVSLRAWTCQLFSSPHQALPALPTYLLVQVLCALVTCSLLYVPGRWRGPVTPCQARAAPVREARVGSHFVSSTIRNVKPLALLRLMNP